MFQNSINVEFIWKWKFATKRNTIHVMTKCTKFSLVYTNRCYIKHKQVDATNNIPHGSMITHNLLQYNLNSPVTVELFMQYTLICPYRDR